MKDAAQGHLSESELVISHLKDNDDREEKKEKKNYRPPSISVGGFPWGWVFLKLILPSTIATWEPGILRSGCRSPGRLRHESLLDSESPEQVEAGQPPKNWVLGQLRHVDILGPLDWQTPEQVEAWQHFEDQIPRQADLLRPPDWNWASPRSPAWPVVGGGRWAGIKGLQT